MASKVYRATHRWAHIQPRKARLVAGMVRGLPVNEAIAALENHPRRGAKLLHKVVKSALANASQEPDVDLNALVLSECRLKNSDLSLSINNHFLKFRL